MVSLQQFFIVNEPDPSLLVTGQYSPWLVLLSLCIAVGASFMALSLAAAAKQKASPVMQRMHLLTGAASLGIGVWSMHFIGMLAFEICTTVSYDPGITLLSMLPSFLAAFVTLNLLAKRRVNWPKLLACGLIVGLGIGSMHYIGMAAMVLGPALRYEPVYFSLSIIMAAGLATLALWISFGLRQQLSLPGYQIRLLASLVMGLAIAGMHYTAMEATRFVGQMDPSFDPHSQQHYALALTIAVVTILLSLVVAALNALVRYRALLQKSEATATELKAIFDTAVDGIIKISAQGEILSFNASAERIFGYTEAEVTGKNISALMPEPYRSAHDGYLMNYLTTGTMKIIGSGREVTALRKDGKKIDIRLAVGESRIKGTCQFVGFVTDITARKKMESDLHQAKEQAIAAAQVKSTFLANMSHEIRTPMNAILGFTELLINTPLNEPQKKNLGIVRSSAKSLLALLNDILDSAKLESGSTELEVRDFSLHQVCDQVIATLSLAARKKGLRLELNYAPQLNEFFRGDPLRIQQVILNLLSNAVKFTERGHVTLRVSPATRGKGVLIAVEDSGIGISADRLDKIFAPFSQADSSMTRRFGGTGLGTTISRQLVELMGGKISVTSTVGEGSTFRFTLPLNTGKPVEGNLYGDEEIRLPPLHILVADDVAQNLELLTAMLESRGHTLVAASNGRQAIDLFSQQPFDLVLMDVQMPEMNGLEACQAIRRFETQQGRSPTPVIALTASVMEQDKRQASAAGMDGFTCKPISVIELTGEIARVLGRQAASQHMYPELRKNDLQLPIDYEMGRTLWGSTQKHLDAIHRFMDSEGATDLLTSAFEHSPQTAIAPAHRLKGIAANLCLPQLARCAGNIEALLKQEDFAEIPSLLTLYRQSLTEITELLEEKTATPEPAEATDIPVEPLDINQLNTLISQLQQGEIPEETFAGLKRKIPADVADNVTEALHDFEPERAAEILITYKKNSLVCHDGIK